jgi:hypothetical protein
MAEGGVTEEEAPGDLEPAGIPPAEENPALTASSPSLDDPVKSPIMQRSHEREES